MSVTIYNPEKLTGGFIGAGFVENNNFNILFTILLAERPILTVQFQSTVSGRINTHIAIFNNAGQVISNIQNITGSKCFNIQKTGDGTATIYPNFTCQNPLDLPYCHGGPSIKSRLDVVKNVYSYKKHSPKKHKHHKNKCKCRDFYKCSCKNKNIFIT